MLGRQETIEKVILAAVAGFLGYLMRSRYAGKKIRAAQAVLEAASAGFVGYIAMVTASAAGIDPKWIGPIVGVLGWMGAGASIRVLEKVVARRLGVSVSSTGSELPAVPPETGDSDAPKT